MKQYDLIVIGSGSAMNVVDPMIQENPKIKVAVIDKDEPGGICLTRGCIPSKILLYPAELVRTLEKVGELGIAAEIKEIDFGKIMERMRTLIYEEINAIRKGLSSSENIDYYQSMAEFVSPYTLKVGGDTITSKMIFLCIGSKTIIPPIKGLEETGYLTRSWGEDTSQPSTATSSRAWGRGLRYWGGMSGSSRRRSLKSALWRGESLGDTWRS